MGTTLHLARRFLTIGGRFTLDPEGCIDFGIDLRGILGLDVPEREHRRRLRRTRAACALVEQRGEELACLVRRRGLSVSGWLVWKCR